MRRGESGVGADPDARESERVTRISIVGIIIIIISSSSSMFCIHIDIKIDMNMIMHCHAMPGTLTEVFNLSITEPARAREREFIIYVYC